MTKFNVWKDGSKDEAISVEAADMNDALDAAASEFGFVDYADMAQAENWSEDEGLNIEAA